MYKHVLFFWVAISFWAMPCQAAPEHASRSPKQTDREAQQAAREEARFDRTWVREWRRFAAFYVEYEDHFICVQDYRLKGVREGHFPIDDYVRDAAYEMTYSDRHGQERSMAVTLPEEEALAYLWILDEPEVGQYGLIHSGIVQEVIGDDVVVLANIQLVDWEPVYNYYHEEGLEIESKVFEMVVGHPPINPDRPREGLVFRSVEEIENFEVGIAQTRREMVTALRFQYAHRWRVAQLQFEPSFAAIQWRIIGLPTEDAVAGERWPVAEDEDELGLQLIVVDVAPDGTVTAVPLSQLTVELTEVQFIDAMQEREVTKAQFYAWFMDARREHRRDYLKPMLAQIEANAPIADVVEPVDVVVGVPPEGERQPREDDRDDPPPRNRFVDGGDDESDEPNAPRDPGFFGIPLE